MTKAAALKIIPKKKVKGNEASVWGEMEVLRGLDHPNIVRFVSVTPRVFFFASELWRFYLRLTFCRSMVFWRT